jgi:chemotaxis protein methyltransferase CheR
VSIVADDYVDFCEGLREICGLDLSQYKRPQMERRLRSFLAQRGITRLSDCLSGLRHDPRELDALLDRVTINVSQLWRHPEQWHVLERSVLPQLGAGGRLRAWSAGCSYGAEAFTLAAVCHRVLRATPVTIFGTDIDARMVGRAREAIFSDADTRDMPPAELLCGFERVPTGWQARSELRAMTRFVCADLLRTAVHRGAFDLIMCRNTVIYFSAPVRDEVHARLAASLRSGGYLVVGATERVTGPAELGLELTFPFIYRKA